MIYTTDTTARAAAPAPASASFNAPLRASSPRTW